MKCPHCQNKLLQKSGGRTRLRTHGPIVFEKGKCFTKCYWCKEAVEVPIEIQNTNLPDERFMLPQGV